MNKKGFEWEIGKIILTLVILLVLLIILFQMKDQMGILWDKIKNILTFG